MRTRQMFRDRHLQELKRLVARGRGRIRRIVERLDRKRSEIRNDYETTIDWYRRRRSELDQQLESSASEARGTREESTGRGN